MLDRDSSPPGTYSQVSPARYRHALAHKIRPSGYRAFQAMPKAVLKSPHVPGVAFGVRPTVPAGAAASAQWRAESASQPE